MNCYLEHKLVGIMNCAHTISLYKQEDMLVHVKVYDKKQNPCHKLGLDYPK